MQLFAIIAAWLALILALLYVYAEYKHAQQQRQWRRIPSRPGLPPDMEYQCWSMMPDFDAGELSDAVVLAVNHLSLPLGRATVFAALRGSRVLIYRAGTYPGDQCAPLVPAATVGRQAGAAVERDLLGLAHALAHVVERKAGVTGELHSDWEERGINDAVGLYTKKRARYA